MIARFLTASLLILLALPNLRADQAPISTPTLDFQQWGLIAVQDGGRRKPIDTLARETLVRLTGQYGITAFNKYWQPSDFLLSLLLGTRDWATQPIILLGYHPLADKLGLDSTRKQFSVEELSHKMDPLNVLLQEAHDTRDAGGKPDLLHQEAENVMGRMALFGKVEKGDLFLIVPAAKDIKQAWLLPPDYANAYKEADFAPATQALQAMATAYVAGDSFKFSSEAHNLRVALRSLSPTVYPSEDELSREYLYNQLFPFDWAALFYGIALAFIGTAVAFQMTNRWVAGLGLVSTATGLAFHITGMVLRSLIGGRPPVTNMYESMIWVSSGVLIFAIIFFIRYRTLLYLVAALPISLGLLLIVSQMPILLPENIDPLVPVLRNNYWLTIHVLTITLSYAAFALAWGFGHITLFQYLIRPATTIADKTMHFWLYRIMQLGILLLAAGTILGGVWANYSWGRFWGWDPKETWALITLLCYIVVLHGRIAGWWRDLGLAVGSAICFLAVVMAWYGVNFVLGAGLHSYGFVVGGDSFLPVLSVVTLDLLFVLSALLRVRHQRQISQLKKVSSVKSATNPEPDQTVVTGKLA